VFSRGDELSSSSASDSPVSRQSRPLRKYATASSSKHRTLTRVPLEKPEPSDRNIKKQLATKTKRNRAKNDGYVAWDSSSSTKSRAGSRDRMNGRLSRDTSPAGHTSNPPSLDSDQLMFGIGGGLGDITSYMGNLTLEISSDEVSDKTCSDEKSVQTHRGPKSVKNSRKSGLEASGSRGKEKEKLSKKG
jgi:hypothetical protein